MRNKLHQRRHLLVLAPHCRSMPPLDRLADAAQGLERVLLNPQLGECQPGLPDGRSLLKGNNLGSQEIRASVDEAVRHAAQREATLVLALLGHGFVPGRTSTLYLMAADSEEEIQSGAVNVGQLLIDAADHPGLRGVIGIVDTCHAGGAPPALEALTAGATNGQTRLALLMAASVNESAMDMRLSRELTALLHKGIKDAGPTLGLDSTSTMLRATLSGQTVSTVSYDGDPFSLVPLWLAHNRRHMQGIPGRLIGPIGRSTLDAALGPIDSVSFSLRSPWDLHLVEQVHDLLLELEPSPVQQRALRAVDGALLAIKTQVFLRQWLAKELSTVGIRRAVTALLTHEQKVPALPAVFTDTEVIDHLAFAHPAGDPDGRRWIARFMCLLALECGHDPLDDRALAWASAVNAEAHMHEAAAFAERHHGALRLQLIISLHSSWTGDWPEEIDAWLLLDGSRYQGQVFTCKAPGRTGTEEALEDAVMWAQDQAESLGLELRRVDVAMPSALLLHWHPEESGTGERLGLRHNILVHWSQRLTPTRFLRCLHAGVKARWEATRAATDQAPVDWLTEQETQDRNKLQLHLRDGGYPRAIALENHPGADVPLMELLLAYTPVLFWPSGQAGFPTARQACLHDHWPTMPEGMLRAYREQWLGQEAGDIADLRAVWDDPEWLAFCRTFSALPPGPEMRNP
ncbi:hypothetical protein PV703_27010 [Streptomyces sp. ME01-24h]|nr:hypothetical protein [Streptomyces sp. ME19-03-3]MDX3356889.1 hypothetical protein [Streptomyces sp. ME01-24h]